jgi:Protein of unknown function (DUF1778).
MKIKSERVEIRLSQELKILAERAATVSGYTMTEYLAELLRKDAPERLKLQGEIQLANGRFDQFIQTCERTNSPGKTILDAAGRLDREGF